MFTIPAGKKCWIRKSGETDWRPHVTREWQQFDRHGLADNGGSWTFSRGGWELKIAACFVVGPAVQEERSERRQAKWQEWKASHGARGIPTGRGASRRRRRGR